MRTCKGKISFKDYSDNKRNYLLLRDFFFLMYHPTDRLEKLSHLTTHGQI